MKSHQSILVLAIGVSCSAGCTSGPLSHFLLTGGAAGAGAAIGDLATHGNPAITAVSAVAGAGLGEAVNHFESKSESKSFTTGYNQGRSDAVKAQYWLIQRQQKPQGDETLLYPVPVPAQQIDGVNYQPTTKYISLPQ